MKTTEPARVRVGRGAAWLDKQDPDWWKRIDDEVLDQHHTCNCVLGQYARAELPMTANYWSVVLNDALGESQFKRMPEAPFHCTVREAQEMGFDACYVMDSGEWRTISDDYDELTDEWKLVLKERRGY